MQVKNTRHWQKRRGSPTVQLERQGQAVVPSLREYHAGYGLTSARADRLSDHALIMHPGPMNRGLEISADVADSSRAVIVEQVANGVNVRMACLYLLLGGATSEAGGD